MIHGTTSAGFAFTIDEGIDRDYRFIRAYRQIKASDPDAALAGAVDLVSIVFNDRAQEDAFLRSIADENGRVPADRVYAGINEILEIAAEKSKAVKNS